MTQRANNANNSPIVKSITLATAIAFFTVSLPVDIVARANDLPAQFIGTLTKFNLPPYFGEVKDCWAPSAETDSGHVVIHVQDAHCNYGAQHKIAEIIEYVDKKYGIDTVNLEGGGGTYDLSIFTDIQDPSIREKAADYFVKEGLINGAEYFAINNPGRVSLWGVEDTGLYLENLSAYRESLKYKDRIEKYLGELDSTITSLKPRIYSESLLELDAKYSQYKAGTVELGEYLANLIDKADASLGPGYLLSFPNLNLFCQSLEAEKNIDFKIANIERNSLIDKLERRLSRNELEELALKAVEFKNEIISQKTFYSYVAEKSESAGIGLQNYSELQKYVNYISTYSTVDKAGLMEELGAFEETVKESLCGNDRQRKLNSLSMNLALLKNLFKVSLTKSDYKYYKDNESSFNVRNYTSFINREAPLCGVEAALDENISGLDGYRESIARFYECSLERDKAFLYNLKPAPGENTTSGRYTLLVTGGFHAESLHELFRKNNLSYISVIPAFEDEDCGGRENPYFKVLSGHMQVQSPLAANAGQVLGEKRVEAFRGAVEEARAALGGEPVESKGAANSQNDAEEKKMKGKPGIIKRTLIVFLAVIIGFVNIILPGCASSDRGAMLYPMTRAGSEGKIYAGLQMQIPLGDGRVVESRDAGERREPLATGERLALLGILGAGGYFFTDDENKELRTVLAVDMLSSSALGAFGGWYHNQDILDSALHGGLGGLTMYSGKRLTAGTIMHKGYLSLLGKPLHSLGVSIRDNVFWGEEPFSRYEIDIGPLLLAYKPTPDGFPLDFALLPVPAVALIDNICAGNNFDAYNTFKTGVVTFIDEDMRPAIDANIYRLGNGENRRFMKGNIITVGRDHFGSGWDKDTPLGTHEFIHATQYSAAGPIRRYCDGICYRGPFRPFA